MRFDHYKSGDLYGIRYHFERVGERLNWHLHDRATAHNMVVMRGSVKFQTNEETKVVEAGEIFDFNWYQEHSIVSLDPDTVIFNILLYGEPEEYRRMPEAEKHGVA